MRLVARSRTVQIALKSAKYCIFYNDFSRLHPLAVKSQSLSCSARKIHITAPVALAAASLSGIAPVSGDSSRDNDIFIQIRRRAAYGPKPPDKSAPLKDFEGFLKEIENTAAGKETFSADCDSNNIEEAHIEDTHGHNQTHEAPSVEISRKSHPELWAYVAQVTSQDKDAIVRADHKFLQPACGNLPIPVLAELEQFFKQNPDITEVAFGGQSTIEEFDKQLLRTFPAIKSADSFKELLKHSVHFRKATVPGGWDDLNKRRDFNEPLEEQCDLLSMDGPNVSLPPRTKPSQAWTYQLYLIAVGAVIFSVIALTAPKPQAAPRKRPFLDDNNDEESTNSE